jgi:hypothetical protein
MGVQGGVVVVEQGVAVRVVVIIQTLYTTQTHRLDRVPAVLGVRVINLF